VPASAKVAAPEAFHTERPPHALKAATPVQSRLQMPAVYDHTICAWEVRGCWVPPSRHAQCYPSMPTLSRAPWRLAERFRLRPGGDAAAEAPHTAPSDRTPRHCSAPSNAGAAVFGSGGFCSTSAGATRFSTSTSRPWPCRCATAADASDAAAAAWGRARASAQGGAGRCSAAAASAAGQPVEIRRPGAGEEARVVLTVESGESWQDGIHRLTTCASHSGSTSYLILS
jgi:hypothetical protein